MGRIVGLLALGWATVAVVGAGAALAAGASGAIAPLVVGVASFGLLASVVGVVAASALRGMLRAGERGERLAGGDVGLLPPKRSQLGERPGREGAGGPRRPRSPEPGA